MPYWLSWPTGQDGQYSTSGYSTNDLFLSFWVIIVHGPFRHISKKASMVLL